MDGRPSAPPPRSGGAAARDAGSRSIAAERSFPRDELDRERRRRALMSLTEELGARMRGDGQVCRGLSLSVRYADRTGCSTLTRSRTLRRRSASTVSRPPADQGMALHHRASCGKPSSDPLTAL